MTLTNSLRRRRRPMRGLRARSGFSLLELTVVLILVGIVMAVAGTKVSSTITSQRVVRAASTIQTQMELAYALAGRNRAPITINFASSSGAILVTVTDRTATTTYSRLDLKATSSLTNGDVTASSSSVTVFPNGLASDTLSINISVTKNGKTYSRRVRMSRAGMVKIV